MNPETASLSIEENFARWPATFCRVTRAGQGNFPSKLKIMPVFKVFLDFLEILRRGMVVAKHPLRTEPK